MRIIRLSNLSYRRSLPSQVSRPTLEFSQFHQEHLGDLTCQYNARSPYLRCAVNPSGPCEGCSYYKSRSN